MARPLIKKSRRIEIHQKTNDSLDNPRFEGTNLDSAPEATLEQVPCICKVDVIYPTFAKKLALRVKPIV